MIRSLVGRAKKQLSDGGVRGLSHATADLVSRETGLRRLGQRLRHRFGRDEIEYCGVRLDMSHSAFTPHICGAIARGQYEQEEARFAKQYLHPEVPVIQLGGGIGYVSTHIDKCLADGVAQVVVEANPSVVEALKDTRTRNGCDFEIFHSAYAPDEETVTMSVPHNFWGGSIHRTDGERLIRVDAVDIESLCEIFDIDRFQLVCDIEGGEIDLLESEYQLLESRCDLAIIEFHHHKDEFRDLHSDIRRLKERIDNGEFVQIDSEAGVVVYQAR